MYKTISRFLFYAVAVVLFLWTANLTLSFVGNILPRAHFLVRFQSLVVFDFGMIAWLIVFIYLAAGNGQRLTALMTCILDFMGVGLIVVAEVFLGGQSLVEAPPMLGEYALWAIGIWTTINVGAVLAFHLLDPQNRIRMAIQAEADEVTSEALKALRAKRTNHSLELADEMSEGMFASLVAKLRGSDQSAPVATVASSGPELPQAKRKVANKTTSGNNGTTGK